MNLLKALRRHAVSRSLSLAPTLRDALVRLGFVQADPIRAPARAQDLILRHRVADYRAGDLEAQFGALSLAEDMLHVYGFLPAENLRLLHPRRRLKPWSVESEHPTLRRTILAHLKRHGATHPRVLSAALGGHSVASGWGGVSAATTRMLEALHYEGRLHVVGRQSGIKIYALAPPRRAELTPRLRAVGLIELLVNLYAPLPLASLRQILWSLGERAPSGVPIRETLEMMIRRGRLRAETIDGVVYVWPATEEISGEEPERVVLLAPFDPLVWDRRRFEHLWGWRYRFEAYTPAKRRQLGYYALPLLWRSEVIGWANISPAQKGLAVELGYIGKAPRERAYRRALEEEIARLEHFLGGPAR
jgi:uncharacterized protein YcaQ